MSPTLDFTAKTWDKFCSMNWSDARFGTPQLYYKEHQRLKTRCGHCGRPAFWFNKRSLPFLIEGTDWVLPLSIGVKEEDGSLFPQVHLELTLSNQNNLPPLARMFPSDLSDLGMKWVSKGRPERLITIKTDVHRMRRNHTKVLSQFQCHVGAMDPVVSARFEAELTPFYEAYWNGKDNKQGVDVEHEYLSSLGSFGLMTTISDEQNTPLGIGYFVQWSNELVWIQSKRKDTKLGIGNSLILLALLWLEQHRPEASLNLGLDLPYKSIWNGEQIWKPGLEFNNPGSAHHLLEMLEKMSCSS